MLHTLEQAMRMTYRHEVMKSVDTIRAGGPGSGCQGENCGRKSSGGESSKSEVGHHNEGLHTGLVNSGFKHHRDSGGYDVYSGPMGHEVQVGQRDVAIYRHGRYAGTYTHAGAKGAILKQFGRHPRALRENFGK